jgi:hypothetical protein
LACDGGHLGFPISIKNRNLVKDVPMIINLQFGFSQFISFREEDLWNSTGSIGTKLSRNVPWMVLYKVTVFHSSRIFNMAARANNMLWLAEISKIFFVIWWNNFTIITYMFISFRLVKTSTCDIWIETSSINEVHNHSIMTTSRYCFQTFMKTNKHMQ